MARVVIAMSGGVDSSLAAALLKEQGHEVTGIMLRLWAEESCQNNRCCTPQAVEEAQLIADQIGIPFYVFDYKQAFFEAVVQPFVQSYEQAQTPNPCILCNERVRFGQLLAEARDLGAEFLATGHYVRLVQEQETWWIHQGADREKDQSYMLYSLTQEQLRHCLFPLGGMNKQTTRALAAERGLAVSSKPDSQDLCFLGDDGLPAFLHRHGHNLSKPGEIVDLQGNLLGRHQGLEGFTVGQRKGIGISHPVPLYVVALDQAQNRLVLGEQPARQKTKLLLEQVHFPSLKPQGEIEVQLKVRYTAPMIQAQLHPLGPGQWVAMLEQPCQDPAPGQSAVFYQGERLWGGGFISQTS